ncbi:hypothetical protein ACIA6D_35245 [Streptomyces cacaoi]|uniref:hypothetical protein n=1 Tax=Streptomyces cacaoi TaxID=1898 RepID=UPI003748D528
MRNILRRDEAKTTESLRRAIEGRRRIVDMPATNGPGRGVAGTRMATFGVDELLVTW